MFHEMNCNALHMVKCAFIISSPEHEVLMVSFCGQWLSIVRRRPSCVNI